MREKKVIKTLVEIKPFPVIITLQTNDLTSFRCRLIEKFFNPDSRDVFKQYEIIIFYLKDIVKLLESLDGQS